MVETFESLANTSITHSGSRAWTFNPLSVRRALNVSPALRGLHLDQRQARSQQ